ncbi:MAG: carboxypeptidase family protein [Shewanella sp.]|nr:carboxypeptidase family protein [Shewanella sp.]
MLFRHLFVLAMSVTVLSSCKLQDKILLSIGFPSANAGDTSVAQVTAHETQILLTNDNSDTNLKDLPKWRNWWYLKFEGLPTSQEYKLVINDLFAQDNRGWEYPYTPLYSYDNKHWQRFEANEVSAVSENTLSGRFNHKVAVSKQYQNGNVWLARFYPYTQDTFNDYYRELMSNHPSLMDEGYFQKQTLGFSPIHHLPIELVTVTNPYIDTKNKKSIWIQARSHAAETGGSFVVEGILNWLSERGNIDVNKALDNFIFYIVPIHNVDGVYEGNYCLNSKSENLENTWYRSAVNPLYLRDDSPSENKIINKKLRQIVTTSAPFSMALNLHSIQSAPKTRAFFFPHFGTRSQGYNKKQTNLWNNSIRFIRAVSNRYRNDVGDGLVEPAPDEGGERFVSQYFPESWWWANFGSQVMAITLETTYENAGFEPEFVTPDKLMALGESLMMSVLEYHMLTKSESTQQLHSEQHNSDTNFKIPSEVDVKS